MISALERAMERSERLPTFTVPKYFTYDAPHSRSTIAGWQRELDDVFYLGPQLSRLVVRYEPGDPWQPIGRYLLWQCVDPSYVLIEPWNLKALNGPSPRSTGHYCAPGWCLCDEKTNRWRGGASRFVDKETWRLYQETGLFGQRWWTIQGTKGGHRFQLAKDELASHVMNIKTGQSDTPSAGDLPFAPFDARVIRAIRAERRAGVIEAFLKSAGSKKLALSAEEEAEAKAKAHALWQWTEDRAEELWGDGADLLPRYFEETYGRVPTGTKRQYNPEVAERRFQQSF